MHIFWWSIYGPFAPTDSCGLYPDKLQVIQHYLKKRGISHVELAERIHVRPRTTYDLLSEKRAAHDSMKRLQVVSKALDIPPALLGLDSQHQDAPPDPPWWIVEGYPAFPAGPDGYPHPGKVIVYYQRTKQQALPNGRSKRWTQADLSEALDGVSESMVRKYERGELIDSQQRRYAIAQILGIPVALLGLDGLQHVSPTNLIGPFVSLPTTFKINNALIESYHKEQSRFFQAYFTNHGQGLAGKAKQWIAHLEEAATLADTESSRNKIILLQAHYHQFLTNVGLENNTLPKALVHTNSSLSLAQAIGDTDMTASSLKRRAIIYNAQGNVKQAAEAIESALQLAKTATTPVRGSIEVDAAWIIARAADSDVMRLQARKHLDIGANLLQQGKQADDLYFVRFGQDIFHLRTLSMLLALHTSQQPTVSEAINVLESPEAGSRPATRRRKMLIDIFYAQALFYKKAYDEATEIALSALEESQAIKSYRGKEMIEELYQQLLATSYGSSPAVARLRWRLKTWG